MNNRSLAELAVAASGAGVADEQCAEVAVMIRDGLDGEYVGSVTDAYLAAVQPLEHDGVFGFEEAQKLSAHLFALVSRRKKRRRRDEPSAPAPAAKAACSSAARAPGTSMLDRLEWKREFKSDQERFHSDYVHALFLPGATAAPAPTLLLKQRAFNSQETGFASTVWDSSIVLSRALERWAAAGANSTVAGRRVVELGSGCGLVGLTAAALGGHVTVTDLPCNVPLLRSNMTSPANRTALAGAPRTPAARSLDWTAPLPEELLHSADVILGTDLFFAGCPVVALAATLGRLAAPHAVAWLAAGRNRATLADFFAAVEPEWDVRTADRAEELHDVFQCDDCDVWVLTRKACD